jgi:hypothetical protein
MRHLTLFSILIWGVKFKKIVVFGPAHHRETFSRIKYLGAVEVGDSTLTQVSFSPRKFGVFEVKTRVFSRFLGNGFS